MKLNNFTGGLSTKLDPTLISASDAVLYTNVNSSTGSLTSIKDYVKQGIKIERWFHKFKNVWYSTTNNREYLEYRNALYWVERDNYPKKVVFGVEKKLGIDPPTVALTSVINNTGSIITTGSAVLQYTYTFYDSSEGVESAPAPFSTELALAINKSVDLSGFQTSTNTAVDKIKIYRVGALTTDFVLIVTLNNGATTYNDNISPLNAPGNILESYYNSPPLLGIRYIVEAYGILFAASGSNLVYTRIGLPDSWPASNSIPVAGDITGLHPIPEGLIIFTLVKSYLLLGTSSANFALTTLNPEHGCLDHLGIAYVRNSLMWPSAQGLCLLVNGSVVVATKDKLGLVKFDPIKAISYDEQYWLVQADGSIFVADFRTGVPIFKLHKYASGNVYSLGVFDNIFYGVIEEDLVILEEGRQIELHYTSPRLTEGEASVTKMYNNIYVRSVGEFVFKILIDGKTVSSVLLTEDKIHDIAVPQEKQRGSDIQFDIRGVGTVKEIEYKVQGRDNGR